MGTRTTKGLTHRQAEPGRRETPTEQISFSQGKPGGRVLCGVAPGPHHTHLLASGRETIVSAEHPGPRFLTIKDVAAELTTSESQIRALISCGDLPAIQIGGQ